MPTDALHIRTVVFPTDGTALAEHAFAQAAFYAGNHDATLHVLGVTNGPVDAAPGRLPDAFRQQLRDAAADAVGLDIVQAHIEAASPEAGILDYAEQVGADLIVMATHGRRGLDHLIVGSVAEAVVRRAPCPVLTACPNAEHAEVAVQRVLAPTDFSAGGYLAAAHAVALARLHGAELHLAHFVEPYPEPGFLGETVTWAIPDRQQLDEAREALRDFAREIGTEGLAVHVHAEAEHPALGVLDTAEHLDADLIVMGSHGRTGVRRFLLGSVAEKVVQLAPCPVFTVKAFGRALLPGLADTAEAASP